MAGLSLASTTSQTTGLPMDLQTLGVSAARIGQTNYSEVQWWLEIYADGGATASNATINVTYSDNTSGNLNVIAVGGTLRIGNMLNLNALKPTNKQDVFIRGINSVILSASTTVAGNFGFTATRARASLPTIIAFKTETYDWAALGLPSIANDSCLQFVVIPTTTSSGIIRGLGSIIYG
jgi:hypothetical protein